MERAYHAVVLIVLTLLVAAALRLWGLPGIPPGPHYDEAANGVLSAEIALGNKVPIFIPSYTGKEVLFFYGAAAGMRLLGPVASLSNHADLLALRLTSALFGLLTVVATAWLAYELFADDDPGGAPWLAALTAALIATSFWHVLLSRVGFRAVTQPLLQALTLAALWRGLRQRPEFAAGSRRGDHGGEPVEPRRWPLLGGFFCGLTGYTYLAARAFPAPLAFTFVALLIFDAGHRRRRLGQFSLFGLVALATFAPLGFYFVRHPDAFTTRVGQVGPGGDWNAALDGVVAAFKMIFLRGDPYIRFNLPLRPLFNPVVALLFIAGLGDTIWRLFRPRETAKSPNLNRAREVLLLVWIPVMLLPTALAVNEITPSNLRAIGLIPLIFVFPARGALRMACYVLRIPGPSLWGAAEGNARYESRITNHLLLLITCTLLFGTALSTARAYFHEYAPRTDLYEASDGDLADIAAYVDQADLTDTTVYVGSVHYRHPTLAFLTEAYPQIRWLVGGSTLVYPASGAALYLFPRSAAPDAGWLARHLPDALPIKAPAAPDGGPAFVGYHLAAPPRLSDRVLADFSGIVRLSNYQVEAAISGAGADVTLIWRIVAPSPHADLTPFCHLTDPWGSRWGQAEPFHYAATDWTPGETVVDRLRVSIAPGAPPGDYLLQVGLYSQSADDRLAVVDDVSRGHRFAGTTVPLTLTVARAETPPDPNTLDIRQRLDMQTSTGPTLLGVNLDTTQARPGERVHLTLFWRAGQGRADHTVNLFLRSVEGDGIPLYSGAPVHGTYPTDRWTNGEIVVDRYNPRLPLAAADVPAGDYPLALTLTTSGGETTLGPITLGQFALVATDRTFEMPTIRNTQRATLANHIELLGYDLDPAHAHPGGTIHLTLYWRVLTEMETSYTVFTHLLGPDESVPAQQDNLPVNGTYPTTLWLPGEIITDPYHISLPSDLPPGDYAVEVGFYIAENGLRLSDPILLNTIISIPP
jgi:hypothetical protein